MNLPVRVPRSILKALALAGTAILLPSAALAAPAMTAGPALAAAPAAPHRCSTASLEVWLRPGLRLPERLGAQRQREADRPGRGRPEGARDHPPARRHGPRDSAGRRRWHPPWLPPGHGSRAPGLPPPAPAAPRGF